MTLERKRVEERKKERWRGGEGERGPKVRFFFFFFYQRCQLLFMRASEPCMANGGAAIHEALCANAPAPLIQMLPLFFPSLA